jgi:hypothetical protein
MEHAMNLPPQTPLLDAARIEALFASDLSKSQPVNPATVEQAIRGAVRHHGGTRGCAAVVAQEFGDHPEMAAPRMRWARATVFTFYIDTRGACHHYTVVPLRIRRGMVGAVA